eukprot:1137832-Rhodomonas_salina.1
MRGIATIVNVLPVENDEGQSVLVSIVEALANVRPQPLYTWLFSPPGGHAVPCHDPRAARHLHAGCAAQVGLHHPDSAAIHGGGSVIHGWRLQCHL